MVRLGKFSIAVKTFGVCDFSRLAVTDWRLRRWRLWLLALMTATPKYKKTYKPACSPTIGISRKHRLNRPAHIYTKRLDRTGRQKVLTRAT